MELNVFIDKVNDRMLSHPVFDEIPEPQFREWIADYLKRESKRIRVALLWAACDMMECSDFDVAVELAVAVELLHNATLVEDDWMDRDSKRRGEPTMHRLRAAEATGFDKVGLAQHYGQTMATLITNMLQSAASRQMAVVASRLDNPIEVTDYFEAAVSQVIRGQMLDFYLQEQILQGQLPTEAEVRHMIVGKTASLFRVVLWLAARASGKPTADWAELGEKIGIAFQLRDDLKDTLPTLGEGNPMGDVIEMKPTLLNVRVMKHLGPAEKDRWLFTVAHMSDSGAGEIVDKMKEMGVVGQAQEELAVMFDDISTSFEKHRDCPGRDLVLSQIHKLRLEL